MKTRIQKWGNSLAVRIPKPFADETHEYELSLKELVAQITPRNRHSETNTGESAGDEVW